MGIGDGRAISRQLLLTYFRDGARPREAWQVGMEIEKMGRRVADGRPLPYDDGPASVRAVLEAYRARRGGDPVIEGPHLIGLDASWGGLSLEPGGQVEWSSRPRDSIGELARDLDLHLLHLRQIGDELGVRWLDVAVDPDLGVADMVWMPKARYAIMRKFLAERGRLAQRMMTQTTSIQCAFDYADEADWTRKFRAAALLAPVATALFANSSRVDGSDSGYRSFRAAIWRETDPARCGLPPVVFDAAFGMEAWLDYVLDVPTIFYHRSRGLVPTGGIPFRQLMRRTGCDAIRQADWETHASTIFTEVRSYSYIEIRMADLLPDELVLAVPAFWIGLLYDPEALGAALELGTLFDNRTAWSEAMLAAARDGLEATSGAAGLRDLARQAVALSRAGLGRGAGGPSGSDEALAALDRLSPRLGLVPD